jgi:glutamine synthetase
MSPREAIQFAREHNARVVDVKFTDLFGMWHHFSMPIEAFTEEIFDEGIGFDGSSIRGFQSINVSDMLLLPDPETVFMDPFPEVPTVSVICNVVDPITRERYTRDPRYVAQKAETYLRSTGVADTAYFGPEVEFYVFNDVRYAQGSHFGYYYIDSDEGEWNTGREEKPNSGLQDAPQGRLLPLPAVGYAARPAHRDDAHPAGSRRRGGGATPRGRRRRSGGDRHQVRYPRAHRRQGATL